MSFLTSGKFWSFIGGIAAAAIAGVAAKQPEARKAAVSVVAKGMEIQQICNEEVQSVRDDAEDLAADARKKAKMEQAKADRRAAIEARIREQVEAELAAEEAAEQATADEAAEDAE